ncbi:MAG: GcrA family cell cycle regulator [Alphaproteobacteria bacterium]|nr:GcrA family cell cycle regulator [Alphaproteobacteria bacterium]
MATDVWTPAILNKMKTLLAKGLSTAEIGKKIGVSKNAVVGKLNRLGWNSKSQQEPKKAVKPAAKKPVPAPAKPIKKIVKEIKKPVALKPLKPKAGAGAKAIAAKPVPKASVPRANSKTLAMHQRIIQHSMDLAALRPDQCRWPIGDPDTDNFKFCGKQVFVGKPYCYEHCLNAYQMQPAKKKS